MSWWTFRRRRSREARLDAELRVSRRASVPTTTCGKDSRRRKRAAASALEFGPLELAKDECREVTPAALARDDRPRRPARPARPRPRAALHAVGHADPHGRHRRHGRDVQRAQRRRAAAAAVRAAARDRGASPRTACSRTSSTARPARTSSTGGDRASRSPSMALYRRISASQVVFAGADAPQRAQEGLVGAEFFDAARRARR